MLSAPCTCRPNMTCIENEDKRWYTVNETVESLNTYQSSQDRHLLSAHFSSNFGCRGSALTWEIVVCLVWRAASRDDSSSHCDNTGPLRLPLYPSSPSYHWMNPSYSSRNETIHYYPPYVVWRVLTLRLLYLCIFPFVQGQISILHDGIFIIRTGLLPFDGDIFRGFQMRN